MTTSLAAHGAVTKASFGTTPDGKAVDIYTLKTPSVEARIMTYGARIVSIQTADKTGKIADVVLGHDTLQGYLEDKKTYFGAIVGRYGNRIAARQVHARRKAVPTAHQRSRHQHTPRRQRRLRLTCMDR